MKAGKIIASRKFHVFGVLCLIFCTVVMALDFGMNFTGYIDLLPGNLIAYTVGFLFVLVVVLEAILMIRNKPKYG